MACSLVSKKSGKTYCPHVRSTVRKDGKEMKLHFFAGEVRDEGACGQFSGG